MVSGEWFAGVKARWDSEFMHELRWFLIVALIAAFAWSYKTEGGNLCKVGCEMNATLSGNSYAGFAQGLYGECRCYAREGVAVGLGGNWSYFQNFSGLEGGRWPPS